MLASLGSVGPEILGLLPLDQASLANVACVSKELRRDVQQAWAYREVKVKHRHAHVAFKIGARHLSVHGDLWTSTRPHQTVPYVTDIVPCLRTVDLRGCHISAEFWTRLFAMAPALTEVTFCPRYLGTTYALTVDSCFTLMSLAQTRLTTLLILGCGCTLPWDRTRERSTFNFTKLRRFAFTGRQVLCPMINAPELRDVSLQDAVLSFAKASSPLPKAIDGLSPLTKLAVESLEWAMTPLNLPLPPLQLPRLRHLHLHVKDICIISQMSSTLAALRALPPSLASLKLTTSCSWEGVARYDCSVTPLSRLSQLVSLELIVSFPTPGCGRLFQLLGAPSTLQRASLWAVRPHADDAFFPDYMECEITQGLLKAYRKECAVSTADMKVCLKSFPEAHIHVRGFSLPPAFRKHARITFLPAAH